MRRVLPWLFLALGLLFGSLGWRLMKVPALEVAGQVLFYLPVLALSSLLGVTATDRMGVTLTTIFYGALFFLVGWAIKGIWQRLGRSAR